MISTQYANRVVVIEKGAAMTAAIRRCKANHPKVVRLTDNKVRVINRKKGRAYEVTLSQPCAELKLAACNCKAGLQGRLCYHIAGALACPGLAAVLPSTIEAEHLERERAILVKPQPKGEKYFGIDI